MTKEDAPIKFGQHVIVDSRTGATFLRGEEKPRAAIGMFIAEMGSDAFGDLSDDHKSELRDFAINSLAHKMTERVFGPKSPVDDEFVRDGILVVGPFQTLNLCVHEKNEMIFDRMLERLVGEHGTDEDRENFALLQKNNAEAAASHDVSSKIDDAIKGVFGDDVEIRTLDLSSMLGDRSRGRDPISEFLDGLRRRG